MNKMENKTDLIKETLIFLALVFGITYGLNLFCYLSFGSYLESPTSWGPLLQIEMFIPAAVAIFCLYLFKHPSLTGKSKIFFTIFSLVVLSGIVGLAAKSVVQYISLIWQAFVVIGFISIIVLNLKKGWRDDLKLSRLSFGKRPTFYVYFPLIFIALFTVSVYLNSFFGLGTPIKQTDSMTLLLTIIQTVLLCIVLGWPLYFGEEYGWRTYLQDRMIGIFGRIKGVVLVGVIWGLWHAPVIAMGYNYPGKPILGVITMTLFSVVIGIYFSFAVFKTGSVWIAVLLHIITNTVGPLLFTYIAYSADPIFSFGMGIYGIAFFTIPALFMLKSDAFKEDDED